MSEDTSTDAGHQPPATVNSAVSVVRSNVPTGLPYPKYRKFLRYDFWFSCAYCTMTESEARAIRFTIDHYESQKTRPELKDQYDNLMYACDECNVRKGTRSPSLAMREQGHRFFRPDVEIRGEHFRTEGIRIEGTSPVGSFTTDAVDLNRSSLRRLRELRQRLTSCAEFVNDGIAALRRFPLDRLPSHIRAHAFTVVRSAELTESRLKSELDALLSEYARSPLIDDDHTEEDTRRNKERLGRLRDLEGTGLHPGRWRSPNKRRR